MTGGTFVRLPIIPAVIQQPEGSLLTSTQWSNIDTLAARGPVPDTNVVYSFHFYEPATLTHEAQWDKSIDPAVLRGLPFPVTDPSRCLSAAKAGSDKRAQGLAEYYCRDGWTVSRIRDRIKKAADWGKSHGAIVIGAEFGMLADHEPASRLAYLGAVRQAMEGEGLGWALWGYDSDFGLNLPYQSRPVGAAPDPAVLAALGMKR